MIALTDIAANKVKEIAAAEGLEGQGLRVQVKGGGCSGFQYDLYFDETASDMDQVVESNGIQIFIDPLSLQYLEDMVINGRSSRGAADPAEAAAASRPKFVDAGSRAGQNRQVGVLAQPRR